MRSLSFFNSKGAYLATSYLDSSVNSSFIFRRRKRFCISSNSGEVRCQNQNLRHGFLSIGHKVDIFWPKTRGGWGSCLALRLALDQTPVGFENSEVVDPKEDEDEKLVELEEVGERNKSGVVDKEKVDVRVLAFTLHAAKTADDVEEVLKDSDELPPPVYSSMIRGFGFDKKLDAAFALVDWLKRKKQERNASFGPNVYIYNSLLGALKQCEQFGRIDEVIEDMKSQGIVPNVVTYNTLMSIHLEQGRHSEALSVLDDIDKNGLSPSPVTYSTVLLAYRETEDVKGAIEFFLNLKEKYEKGEIGGDKEYDWDVEMVKLQKYTIRICYLVMRQMLVKEENPSTNVLKVLTEMDKARLKPGREECERLIWACTRENHYTIAREFYKRIREMESDISLSVCNHVIWLMGKAKKWWAALEIYEDLLDKGPKPNNLSYELIMSHFNILLTAAREKGIWRNFFPN